MADIPTTVAQFKAVCPEFFSKHNKQFFGDAKHSVYHGFLIIKTTKKLSVGSYTNHIAYRWNESDKYISWVADANNRPLLLMKLRMIETTGVRSEHDLPSKVKENF